MELRALRYFVTVAEELHFGRAAERLRIVQPAVSQQVARLERELGATLLDRSSRHVRLTAAGHRVLAAARDALAAADRVHDVLAEPATLLRLGTAPGLTARLEIGIERLRASNPDLEVQLFDMPVPDRLEAVRSGALDLAVLRGRPDADGLLVQPAWTEPLHAVVSDRHPLAGLPAVALPALAAAGPFRHPCRSADPPWHDALARIVRAAGIGPGTGRALGTEEAAVVEIGAEPAAWTLLPAGRAVRSGSARIREIPLDPPAVVTGSVVAAGSASASCRAAVVAAFGDAAREAAA
jgi:DNA-binding transcriptional LysR family regulator